MKTRSLDAEPRVVVKTAWEPAVMEAPLPGNVFPSHTETFVPDFIPIVVEEPWGGFHEAWGPDDSECGQKNRLVREIMEVPEGPHACSDVQDEWQEPEFRLDLEPDGFPYESPPIQDGHEWVYSEDWEVGTMSSKMEDDWLKAQRFPNRRFLNYVAHHHGITFQIYECSRCQQRVEPLDDQEPIQCSLFIAKTILTL